MQKSELEMRVENLETLMQANWDLHKSMGRQVGIVESRVSDLERNRPDFVGVGAAATAREIASDLNPVTLPETGIVDDGTKPEPPTGFPFETA